jgi:hypothetical protein
LEEPSTACGTGPSLSTAGFAGFGGGTKGGAGKEFNAIGGWLTPPAEASTTAS